MFLTQYSDFKRTCLTSKKPSLTDESFRDECDITLMIERYRKNKIPPKTVSVSYGYSPTPEDMQNAQLMLAEVKSSFEALPSDIRDEFKNDVSAYLDYISDEKNLKDIYERGLVDISTIPIEKISEIENSYIPKDIQDVGKSEINSPPEPVSEQ